MFNLLISMLILVIFVLCVCVIGVIYCRNEKMREERRMMEEKKDMNQNPDAAITQFAMHNRYNGLNTRGRIN